MEALRTLLDKHGMAVLSFSAGKDAAACLKVCEPELERIVVAWVNGGDPYPETLEYMQEVRARVPHFVEVRGNQPEYVSQFGYPTDAYLLSSTQFADGLKYSFTLDCCRSNLWEPLYNFVKARGYTAVIRGQKLVDGLKSPIRSGHIADGVEYYFPLEQWTDEEVLSYVGKDLPASYSRGLKTSLDCATCTGYVSHNKGRLADLAKVYPSAYDKIVPIVADMKAQLKAQTEALNGF